MKFDKIKIIFKNIPDSDDDFDGGTHDIVYGKGSIIFTNEHLVLELAPKKNEESNQQKVTGHVFPIKTIKNYITYTNN